MKQTVILLVIVLASAVTANAQKTEDDVCKWYQVEVRAQFPGGDEAMDEYISKHLKIPNKAYKKAKSGTVMVEFVVEKDGSLSGIRCSNVEKVGYGVEESIIKMFKGMPRWKPATFRGGKPARMQFSKPIRVNF
jgi:protein TonB